MELVNQVRGYHFLLGIFRNQQKDPFCSVCSAYANTLKAAQEGLERLAAEQGDALAALAPPFPALLAETRAGLAGHVAPVSPSGQKKAENCKLPKGVCFIKASFALIQTI